MQPNRAAGVAFGAVAAAAGERSGGQPRGRGQVRASGACRRADCALQRQIPGSGGRTGGSGWLRLGCSNAGGASSRGALKPLDCIVDSTWGVIQVENIHATVVGSAEDGCETGP